MPSRAEIQQRVVEAKTTAQDFVRKEALKALHEYSKNDVVLYATGFTSAKQLSNIPQALFSVTVEDMQGFMSALHGLRGDSLDLILHSPGGSLDAADQLVQYLRSKYSRIRALVPQNAMSAATMIACACDEIVMGKHSAIGPIDPQITVPTAHGLFTSPAQCILDDFEAAKKDIASDRNLAALWATRMRDYPPGILQICRNTLELAVTKVTSWLSSFMFQGDADAFDKASKIAKWLGNASEHKTHGRPIGIAAARQAGLKVSALEDEPALQERLLSVFHATAVTFDVSHCVKMVENHQGRGWFTVVEPPRS
jgi:ATP-dependent protease ClpP protease subunit